jgi:nitrogenase molybdenum-iron protein alpha/beta subunit
MKTVTERDLEQIKMECERLYWEHTNFVMSMCLAETMSEDVEKSFRYKRHHRRISRRDLGRLWFAPIKKARIPLRHIPLTTEGILVRRRVYPIVIRKFMEECSRR